MVGQVCCTKVTISVGKMHIVHCIQSGVCVFFLLEVQICKSRNLVFLGAKYELVGSEL